ncbi:MAG TPA: hypothetical protein VM686_11655 [Polyangiaceae bacterium]|nr:hypothetical protein [Polyangiaceae bacterium]
MLTLLAVVLTASCSLAVDTDELQAGAAALDCADDEKVCPDRLSPKNRVVCVSKSNPSYGCGEASCAPCSLSNATTHCNSDDKKCAVTSCQGGYKDCNDDEGDGCEADVDRDETNCGSCKNRCGAENGVAVCSKGECQIVYCSAPFANCDERYSTGCETDVRTSSQHCGGCNQPCAGTCVDRVCHP